MGNTYTQIYLHLVFAVSQIDTVVKYINNQETHHRKRSFREEYIEFLEKYKIVFNEKYVLTDVD